MNPISNNQSPITDLPDDVVLSVRNVSKKFCRNLKRSMVYGTLDLVRNMLGIRPGTGKKICSIGDLGSGGQSHALSPMQPIPNETASPIPNATNPQSPISPRPGAAGLRKGEFRALNNINFDLRRGEGVGLIGANGSGKTTLLRILNGIFPPDEGCVTFRGRMGALIALGAGFHPHLSGRENVFLNGAILGMDRARMEAVLPDIIRFAEIGEFIDAPVSTYSSGMYVRLGFAVAAFTEPDIMLVDEVLAVGDIAFRAKCSEKITELRSKGMSVVFVGHDMNAVQALCSRVLWLDHGTVRQEGEAAEVVEAYMCDMDRAVVHRTVADLRRTGQGTGAIDIVKTVLRNAAGQETDTIRPFESLSVELHYEATQRIEQPYFWVGIGTAHGSFAGANMLLDGHRPDFVEGHGRIVCHFGPLPLLPQAYRLHGGIRSADGMTMLIESRTIGAFRVEGGARTMGLEGEIAAALVRLASPVLVPYAWEFNDGHRAEVDFKGRGAAGATERATGTGLQGEHAC